ncbi:MAG TPA: glycosyltransferase [Candidatus Acidoferrales bacterium]|nr:glycosyltransferase [Candidatus Acidoferrales bacterium]
MKHGRILHLRASNFVGGPERQLLLHAQAQRDGEWNILLGTFLGEYEGQELRQHAESLQLPNIALPSAPKNKALKMLVSQIRSAGVSLLCTHGYKADILGVIAGRITRVPVACFLRGWTHEDWKVSAYERLDRWCLRYADRIVCLSNTQGARIATSLSIRKRIRIVCNAIESRHIADHERLQAQSELRRRLDLPVDSKVVATAGRLSPEKGVADFLDAVRCLQDEFPAVRFVVFGDGFLREELRNQARALGIEERVRFAGFQKDLQTLLPGIDLLINPSHSEEMPNILLEAMSAKIPVVATDVGGVAEIAGTERALRLVPSGYPHVLAMAIRDLVRNTQRAERLAEAGHRRVEQTYSIAAQQKQFDALYRELLPNCKYECSTRHAVHDHLGSPV